MVRQSGNNVGRINEVTRRCLARLVLGPGPSSGVETTSVYNQPSRPTELPTLSGTHFPTAPFRTPPADSVCASWLIFSGRELAFTFAICHRRSVCRLSSVCLSACLSVCLSVTLVRPTQPVEIFGIFFTIR